MHCIGITREPLYSPGKIDADRAILEAVATRLRGAGHRVDVLAPEALPARAPAPLVFAMCQGPAALATLQRWDAAGARIINSPAAIAGCHRRPMLDALAAAGVPHPVGVVVSTAKPGALPAWVADGAWVKRGDVHATEPADVERVAGLADAAAALAAFAARGIDWALVQRHVPGEPVKFYAVRGGFFRCRPENGGPPMDGSAAAALATVAAAAGAALDLEVFGGDGIRRADGDFDLIDLNDWPSYASCRREAADAIASYISACAAERV